METTIMENQMEKTMETCIIILGCSRISGICWDNGK